MYNQIQNKDVELPEDFSPELVDFLRKLLEKDPKKRLGKNGIQEIINHKWLKDAQSCGPPLQFTAFRVDQIVTQTKGEIDKRDTDLMVSSTRDGTLTTVKKQLNLFSYYSDSCVSGREIDDMTSGEAGEQENEETLSADTIKDVSITRPKRPTLEKKKESLVFNFDESEIDEATPQEAHQKPTKIAFYELNAADKLQNFHSFEF
mmetsp:Transcript_55056/g.63324  ORF Transcript_55056/g.63324 Transcript_55056/m.63324 type:complete len:204 (-) Transcript_55056:23-634(-)